MSKNQQKSKNVNWLWQWQVWRRSSSERRTR